MDHEPFGLVISNEPCVTKKIKFNEPGGSVINKPSGFDGEKRIVTSQVVCGDRIVRGRVYTQEQWEARERAIKAKKRSLADFEIYEMWGVGTERETEGDEL